MAWRWWLVVVLVPRAVRALRPVAVRAFVTKAGGSGNPASVAVLGGSDWPEDAASVAAGASRRHGGPTTFVREASGKDAYELRYFGSDGSEMPFCGHATLAAAEFVCGKARGSRAQLATAAGKRVLATRADDGGVVLALDAGVAAAAPPEAVAAAAAALGGVAVEGASFFDETTLVLECDREAYGAIGDSADAAALALVRPVVAVTARGGEGDGGLSFRSRCFVRGGEDLACGVAHAGLGPYWAGRLGASGLMRARQDSPTGADLAVRLDGEKTVCLGGLVARDSIGRRLGRALRGLVDAIIAPGTSQKSLEDEAKEALITGAALRLAFIAATAAASAWSLTLFGATWRLPEWRAPVVKAPVVTLPTVKAPPALRKPEWRLKTRP